MKLDKASQHNQLSCLLEIARKFHDCADSCEISLIGQGNINLTYLVHCHDHEFIMQRISASVFKHPHIVAGNSAKVARHVQGLLSAESRAFAPIILKALDGENYVEDNEGQIWRAQKYIKNTFVYEKILRPQAAYEAGRCLAMFHKNVAGISLQELGVTLPGFHNLPGYLNSYDAVVDGFGREEVHDQWLYCMDFIDRCRADASYLEQARRRGLVPTRIIHGDPKVSNILFSKETGRAVSMIDLDTVGPGILLCDLGDFLRSICCSSGEGSRLEDVRCDTALIAAALKGYVADGDLSHFEKESLYHALYLISFELGVRFFTDYLQGNRYFKVSSAEQNLHRAMVQFKLVQRIKEQRPEIVHIARSL